VLIPALLRSPRVVATNDPHNLWRLHMLINAPVFKALPVSRTPGTRVLRFVDCLLQRLLRSSQRRFGGFVGKPKFARDSTRPNLYRRGYAQKIQNSSLSSWQ